MYFIETRVMSKYVRREIRSLSHADREMILDAMALQCDMEMVIALDETFIHRGRGFMSDQETARFIGGASREAAETDSSYTDSDPPDLVADPDFVADK